MMLVSHDQHFLNGVCTQIVLLEGLQLHYFVGDYDDFTRKYATFSSEQRKRAAAEHKELTQLTAALAKGTGQSGTKSGRAKMKERIEQIKGAAPPQKEYKVQFLIAAAARRLNPPLITMSSVAFEYAGGTPLFSNLNFEVSMDSRVALVGPNGCGKSTFLNLLSGSLAPTSGDVDQANGRLRVGLYAQHLVDALPTSRSSIEHLHALLGEGVDKGSPSYQQVRYELGTKGLPSYAHELKLRDLSGGQRARVVFAELATQRPHVLLLDEPTNHLDLESIDALIAAINAFEGGVVLISHDRRLLQATNCALWLCEGGGKGVKPLGSEYDFAQYEAKVLREVEARVKAEQMRAKQRAAMRQKRKEEAARKAAAKRKAV
jgi:ATP-binding cassette subfamily F protein 1